MHAVAALVLWLVPAVDPQPAATNKPAKPDASAHPAAAKPSAATPEATQPADAPRAVKPVFRLSRETTYVTGPLDAEGYVDYAAALNEHYGRGVTPDTNAAVLFMQAAGPKLDGTLVAEECFRLLGIEPPAEHGDYFVDFHPYLSRGKNDGADPDPDGRLFEQYNEATRRPWKTTDQPELAAWLQANAEPIKLLLEAAERPKWYLPMWLDRKDDEPTTMFSAPLPDVATSLQVARCLAIRAMQDVGEGRHSDAWKTIVKLHRLGRLFGHGPTLVQGLTGVAIESMAAACAVSYLAAAKLSSVECAEHLAQLQNLPPRSSAIEKIDLSERFMYLDTVQYIRRGGAEQLRSLGGATGQHVDAIMKLALEKINFEPALELGNEWYSRIVAALRMPAGEAKQDEFEQIDRGLRLLHRKEPADWALRGFATLMAPDWAAGQAIGERLVALLTPSLYTASNVWLRAEQNSDNLNVAFALAAYRADVGRYPATLAELAPKYLPQIPRDRFSENPLVYKKSADGYLLYSVGMNGLDEEGRSRADDNSSDADDLAIHMPPKLKTP